MDYLIGRISRNADLHRTGPHVVVDDRVGLLEDAIDTIVQGRSSVLLD